MAEILEIIMLICFGASWPMALTKNIRAKSAKGMSLPFILLIILGYLAGLMAKVVTHNVSFVFWVYVLNLAIVTVNLMVYFYNYHLDRKAAGLNKIEEDTDAKGVPKQEARATFS